MARNIYVTIDDTPSMHTQKLVSYLVERKVPAVFYARGENITRYQRGLIEAISQGFLVGNHSYTHPYFSRISFDKCAKEIEKTELLIEQCYRLAKKTRDVKVIRLPWSDRGAGQDLRKPQDERQAAHCRRIDEYPRAQGFSRLCFRGFENDQAIDAPYSWKTEDFKEKYLTDHAGFIANLSAYFERSKREYEIVLAHDFDRNYDLLRLTIDFLIAKGARFLTPCSD